MQKKEGRRPTSTLPALGSLRLIRRPHVCLQVLDDLWRDLFDGFKEPPPQFIDDLNASPADSFRVCQQCANSAKLSQFQAISVYSKTGVSQSPDTFSTFKGTQLIFDQRIVVPVAEGSNPSTHPNSPRIDPLE
jgi:hypothetical protein